jgi:hypothetical protein
MCTLLVLYITVSEVNNLIVEKSVIQLRIVDELYGLVLQIYYCE